MNKDTKFKVVEGLVQIDEKKFNHTWIIKRNQIIDPTFAQFKISENNMFHRISLKKYTPKQYLNLNRGELTVYQNVIK